MILVLSFFTFLRDKGEVVGSDPVTARKEVNVNSTTPLAESADPVGMWMFCSDNSAPRRHTSVLWSGIPLVHSRLSFYKANHSPYKCLQIMRLYLLDSLLPARGIVLSLNRRQCPQFEMSKALVLSTAWQHWDLCSGLQGWASLIGTKDRNHPQNPTSHQGVLLLFICTSFFLALVLQLIRENDWNQKLIML